MAYFADRVEAGKRLSLAFRDFVGKNAIVLAIPRGGVVVGYWIADKLSLPLDVIIPRKIGAPDNAELAIGAMTEDGTIILDERLVSYLGVSQDYIRAESSRQKSEIGRRLKVYRGNEPYPNLKGRDVIVVDDGPGPGPGPGPDRSARPGPVEWQHCCPTGRRSSRAGPATRFP